MILNVYARVRKLRTKFLDVAMACSLGSCGEGNSHDFLGNQEVFQQGCILSKIISTDRFTTKTESPRRKRQDAFSSFVVFVVDVIG